MKKDKPIQQIAQIPITKLKPPEIAVRNKITVESVEDLRDSIKQHGIIEPLIVRKAGSSYKIIAGHRRAFAADLAGLKIVPCIVRKEKNFDGEILKLEENLKRQDISPIEESNFYNMLVTKYKIEPEALSQQTGKSLPYIYERLGLSKWPDNVRDALAQNLITYSVARLLAKIDNESIRENYLGYAIDSGVSPTIAAQWLRDYKSDTQKPKEENPEAPKEDLKPPEIKIKRICPICQMDIEAKDATLAYCHPECLAKIEKG